MKGKERDMLKGNRIAQGILSGLILFSFIIYGCTVKVPVTYQMPARIDLSRIKSIAVLDFEGRRDARKWVPEVLTIRLQQTRYFKVIERERIAYVLKEQGLGMTGLIDPKTAAKVGKILAVDAVIYGRVGSWEVKDVRGTYKYTYKKEGRKYTKYVPYIKRRAYVCFTVKVVDTNSAEVIASDLLEGDIEDRASGEDRYVEIKPKDKILFEAAKIGITNFVRKITPHMVYEERKLMSGDKEVKVGIQYAKKGRWERAIEVWRKVLKARPHCSPAHYNLGVSYEVTGRLYDAKREYEEAEKLEPKEEYMNAVIHINKLIQAQKRLEEQMEGRR